MEHEEIMVLRAEVDPGQSWRQVVWTFLQFAGGLAVLGAWAWLAVFLWRDEKELFAGAIAALFVAGIVMAWRAWPRAAGEKKSPD